MSGYKLGAKSHANMAHLHPTMVKLAHAAIARSTVDWGFTEPLTRTKQQQAEKVRLGFSKTMNSNHLIKPDGYGHAVDCVPWIQGAFTWGENKFGWPVTYPDGTVRYPFFEIAAAWREVAIEAGQAIVWGGVWDRDLRTLPPGWGGMRSAMLAYNERHVGRDWNDGPHMQLGAP